MAIQLFTTLDHSLKMKPGLPRQYNGAQLKGSEASHYSGAIGQIILQEINNLQYTIRYAVFRIAEEVKLKFVRQESGLQTTAILQNYCRATITGAGRFKLGQGYFSTLFSQPWEGMLQCVQNSELISFDTTWDAALLHEFIPEESKWWDIFKNVHHDIPTLIGYPYRKITPALSALIEQVKYSSYHEDLRKNSIDHLLKEYLAEILCEIDKPHWLDGEISKSDFDKIEAVKNLIASNPLERFHSAELARSVYMNECKLKSLFSKVTGMGTFDYMMFLRCRAVRDRILNTDLPLKAFIDEAGYSDLANFVNGFKRHMGCTPADIRK